MKVAALAGGVGGARLADGLIRALAPGDLTVIVNTGDDFDHFGLRVCPDLDTVCYTLAGLANPSTGWGRIEDTWYVMEAIEALGGPSWFRLGDRDLATSLERTRLLGEGLRLSQVTARFCESWEVPARVLPMADEPCPTVVVTDEGDLDFQDYFVRRRCEPRVVGFRYGAEGPVEPAPGVLAALQEADVVIVCPSNPWVSVDPILSVAGVRRQLAAAPVVAVSPIIGGRAVKGPAAKMFRELSIDPSPAAVADHYSPFLDGLVMDREDQSASVSIRADGIRVLTTGTLMESAADRLRLAREVIEFAAEVVER